MKEMKQNGLDPKSVSEELSRKSCPLAHNYDSELHDLISRLRIVDGSLPEHATYGRSVDFFAPAGQPKYWVKNSTPPFGFFFYYTLDMAICPYLVSIFGIQALHPNTEDEVDELLKLGVDV